MSGNQFITTWMRGLLDQGQRVFRMYLHHFQDRVPLPKLSHHLAMIAAIEKGDAEGAERASKADADALIEEVVKILGQLPTSVFSLDAGKRKGLLILIFPLPWERHGAQLKRWYRRRYL